MFESLANLIRHSLGGNRPDPHTAADPKSDFESVAMSDELRLALFPRQEKMVSQIFDRPVPARPRPAAQPELHASPPPGARTDDAAYFRIV